MVKILDLLEKESSTNAKKEILKKYPEIKELLTYALNPFMMYSVTSHGLTVTNNENRITWEEMKNSLNKLYHRVCTGNNAIELCNIVLSKCDKEHGEMFLNILDKKVKGNVGVALVNSVYPNLIPEFDVQLAYSWDKLDLPFKNTVASRKLDGVRAVIEVTPNNIKVYSRNGKEILTLESFKQTLSESLYSLDIPDEGIYFDGEMCVYENNMEDFKAIVSQLRRKDYDIKNAKFFSFDIINGNDFRNGKGDIPFNERYNNLKTNIARLNNPAIKVLEQFSLNNEKDFEDALTLSSSKGWEGLILKNADALYEGKRTKNLLKAKKFIDGEFLVIDMFEGTGKYKRKMGGVYIEYKGNKVGVGSGFTEEDREYFWKNPNEIVGKKITVKYFAESKDKNNNLSLRFPTYKGR